MSAEASAFYDALRQEVLADPPATFSEENIFWFHKYYKGFRKKPKRYPFYKYNWGSRVSRAQEVIRGWPRQAGKTWQVLDAGSGVGTESFFWSSLRDDVMVTGADLSIQRVETAQARMAGFAEQWQRPFSGQFVEKNVLDLMAENRYDLIWAMEAISHIDPAEDFIRLAGQSVTDEGALVISDSHRLNPMMLWRIFEMRQEGVPERSQKELSTGEEVSLANERLFSVGELTPLLREAGFKRIEHQLTIFFPPTLADFGLLSLGRIMDRVGNALPGMRLLGGIYTTVAYKRP
ncbi:MAG TPA: class I SAM-dependent methyltransferase [Anaerolineae bacterium]|nr:class I SAM-dependent methyltransferase [Anaerolineae bacterium]